MNTGQIFFSCNADDGYDIREFDLVFAKNDLRAKVTFYGAKETFVDFGEKLVNFPDKSNDKVLFRIPRSMNSYGEPMTGYDLLLLEAYCFSPSGQSALRVVGGNDEELPYKQRFEFYFSAEIASLNNLGNMLINWQTTDSCEMVWETQTS